MAAFNQYMRDGHLLTDEQYKKVVAVQSEGRGLTFYSALRRANVIPEERLLSAACDFFKVKRVGDAYKVGVDFAATEQMMGSVEQAIETRMFAVLCEGKLTCVLNDPENDNLKNKAISALGVTPEFAIVSESEFTIINQYQLTPRVISDQANQIKVVSGNVPGAEANENASYTQKLLDTLIAAALERRASDLNIQPMGDSTARVILRVDGKRTPYTTIKADVLPNLRNKLRTMSGTGGETESATVAGQINANFEGKHIDIRINIVRSVFGYDFNLRFIDSTARDLEDLGLSKDNYNRFMELINMTKGLIILCGPTGSGKTSLLYAGYKKMLMDYLAIYTMEDPVEIKLPGATQIQVDHEKGETYAEKLPDALRHDPDVLGIGEIRIDSVAQQVVETSNTGHLTLTTIHTNDSIAVISRMLEMEVDPYTLGDALSAVVAQRLLRRICPNCAKTYELRADHVWRKRYNLGDGRVVLRRGCGCSKCAGTGYYGRIGVHEFLIVSRRMRTAIQEKMNREAMETILKEEGFTSYLVDAKAKALKGITDFAEVDKLWNDMVPYYGRDFVVD